MVSRRALATGSDSPWRRTGYVGNSRLRHLHRICDRNAQTCEAVQCYLHKLWISLNLNYIIGISAKMTNGHSTDQIVTPVPFGY